MNKAVLAVVFLSSAAVFVPLSAAWSQGMGGSISLQDVDTNKDGKVSPDESRAYIMRLEQAHDFEEQQARNAAKLKMEAERAAAQPVQNIAEPAIPAVIEPATPAVDAPSPVVEAAPKEMVRTIENAPVNDQRKLDKRLQEMKTLDLNNDGILQASELQGAATKKFEAADTNKDGVISPEEVAASLSQFSQEQEDSYGKATVKQEANRLKNRLKTADTNRDGQVSKEEYEAFMNERQSLFDRDGDGIITEDEYRTDGEKLPSTYRKDTREQ